MAGYLLLKDSSTHECSQEVSFTHADAVITSAEQVSDGASTATAEQLYNIVTNTVTKTEYFPASLFVPDDSSGPSADSLADGGSTALNAVSVETLSFPQTTDTWAWLTFSLPPEWNAGTVKVKILWTADTGAASGEDVSWEVAIGSCASGELVNTTMGTAVAITDDVTTTMTSQLRFELTDASSAITVGGLPTAGDMLVMRIMRDVSHGTPFSEDAHLIGIHLQYTVAYTSSSAW